MKVIISAALNINDAVDNYQNNLLMLEHFDIAFGLSPEPCTRNNLPAYIYHGVKHHQVASFVELARHYGQEDSIVVMDDNRARLLTTDPTVFRMFDNIGNYQRVDSFLVPYLKHTVRTHEGKWYAACTATELMRAKDIVHNRNKLTSAAELEANIYGKVNTNGRFA